MTISKDSKFPLFIKGVVTFIFCALFAFNFSGCAEQNNSKEQTELQAEAGKAKTLDVRVADDDVCNIRVVGNDISWSGKTCLKFSLENKSDKVLKFIAKDDSFTVNGMSVKVDFSVQVNPEENKSDFLYIDSDEIKSIDQLVDIKGIINVLDDDTLEVVREYPLEIT